MLFFGGLFLVNLVPSHFPESVYHVGTLHGLFCPCAIQPCMFTCICLPTDSTMNGSSELSISEQEKQMKMLEKLVIQVQKMTCERDELRGILAIYTDKDLNNRYSLHPLLC